MVATVFDIAAAVIRTAEAPQTSPREKCKMLLFSGTSFIYNEEQSGPELVTRDYIVPRDFLMICENALPIPEIDRGEEDSA